MSRARLRAGREVSYIPTPAELAALPYSDPADRWAAKIVSTSSGSAILSVTRPDGARLTRNAIQGNGPGQFSFDLVTRGSHPSVTPTVTAHEASGVLHFYLAADAQNAGDHQAGTNPAAPLKTLDEAYRRVNALVRTLELVIVHIAAAPVNGAEAYKWTQQLGPVELAAPLIFIGDGAGQAGDDGFTELLVDTVDSGATVLNIPVTGGGMALDEYLGKTLELTSGTQEGWRRTINGNDATSLDLGYSIITAPLQNDTLRVLEPSVEIGLNSMGIDIPNLTPQDASQIVGVGQTTGNQRNQALGVLTSTSMVYFVNVRFNNGTASNAYQLTLQRSTVCLLGVEFLGGENLAGLGLQLASDSASLLVSGTDFSFAGLHAVGPRDAGLSAALAVDNRAWGGWSTFFDSNGIGALLACARYIGFIHVNDGLSVEGGNWLFLGGRISAAGKTVTALDLWRGAWVQQEGTATGTPLVIDSDENAAGTATISVRGGALLNLGQAVVKKDNQGHAILVYAEGNGQGSGPGVLSVNSTTLEAIATLTQPTNAIRVCNGGRCNYRSNPTIVGAFATELAVASSPTATPAAGASGSFATLATDGDAYPTIASGLTGVNGFIQRL